MAALTTDQKKAAWKEWISLAEAAGTPPITNKPLLADTADAVNTWLDTNIASALAALPSEFASNTSTDEKARMLVAVVRAKYGV